MAKLTITLKQHTPLIHFQSEQEGATIRATEFKAKLDKFLIKHVFFEKFEDYKKFLIGYKDGKSKKDFGDKEALNYKIRFYNMKVMESPCEIEYKKNNNRKDFDFPLYFGNMGKDKKRKEEYLDIKKSKFILFDSIDLEVFSLKKCLIDKIAENLHLFLMKHNFGQRQSKGFGSLYINEAKEYYIDGVKGTYTKDDTDNSRLKYCFEVKIQNNVNVIYKSFLYKEYFSLFTEINKRYTFLRAGNRNIEPFIKLYAIKNKMTWDKDIINKEYYKKNIKINYPGYLIKDLLGLSVDEYWKTQDFNITKTDKCKEIERFQSPIFFKPIRVSKDKFFVYYEAREIHKEFLDKTFIIKRDGEGDLELKTPSKFNLDEFIEFVIEKDKSWNINKLL